ncbi:MAG: hypothetical protein V4671_06380 [Armatimonadota bacterium]
MRRWLRFSLLLAVASFVALGLTGCTNAGKRTQHSSAQSSKSKPSPIYTSVAEVFLREGCTIAPWKPDAPNTLTVRFPASNNPRDLDRGTAQLVATAARQKLGPDGRVYIYAPDRSVMAYATPEHPQGR